MSEAPNTVLALWLVVGVATATVLYAIWAGRGVAVRYILAMVFACVGALVATLFISSAVASYVTSNMTFDSPDGVELIHALVWLGVNGGALVLGWIIGWFLSGPIVRRRKSI
ncbi:MAG: hypothetical protein AAF732_23645 [Pseudomonadota bacterium]